MRIVPERVMISSWHWKHICKTWLDIWFQDLASWTCCSVVIFRPNKFVIPVLGTGLCNLVISSVYFRQLECVIRTLFSRIPQVLCFGNFLKLLEKPLRKSQRFILQLIEILPFEPKPPNCFGGGEGSNSLQILRLSASSGHINVMVCILSQKGDL